jgi:hypothetical protein
MASVTAGDTLVLLSQWYTFSGGVLVDLDATPSITITNIGTGATALATTTTGVTHPGTGAYGYSWVTSSSLAAGSYLVTWAGLKSSVAVNSDETVTVTVAGATPTTADKEFAVYTTRETIKRALEIQETARSNHQIDRAIRASSRIVEGITHRTFYPEYATKKFDWPNIQGALPWRLWLDSANLVELTSLSSTGGGVVGASDALLEPNRTGPPYSRIELKLSSASAFGGGSTYQQSILVTGIFGYSNEETTTGLTTTVNLSATATSVNVDGTTSSMVGVGSIIRMDDERCIVTERSFLNTSVVLASALTNSVTGTDTMVAVADGTQFSPEEILLIDSEKFLIVDIVGNNLLTRRAFDGTTTAAHTISTPIYANRTLQIRRGALGTTAGIHSTGTTVYLWEVPYGIREFVTAYAISDLLEEQTGWFRTMSAASSTGGAAKRPATMVALQDLRDRVSQQYTRKARQRTI